MAVCPSERLEDTWCDCGVTVQILDVTEESQSKLELKCMGGYLTITSLLQDVFHHSTAYQTSEHCVSRI